MKTFILLLGLCLITTLSFADVMEQEITYKLHTPQIRDWGYEIPVTFSDADKDYNIVMLFKKKPEQKQIDEMVLYWKEKINIIPEEPDEMISKSEVEGTLRNKGYLSTLQVWEDLPKKFMEVVK